MKVPYKTDGGAGARARLGMVVLQGDETIEPEFRVLCALPDVALYCTRIPCAAEVSAATLAEMAPKISAAASLLPLPLNVVGYACTSGATIIGPDKVSLAVREVCGAMPVTDPLTAVKAACRALRVRRLGFLTPYIAEVSAAMRQLLQDDGLTIADFASFEESEDSVVARIAPESVRQAALQVGRSCDAVFISCTSVRTLDIIPAVEDELGVPVLSSNLSLAWHMLRLAGVEESPAVNCKLFETVV